MRAEFKVGDRVVTLCRGAYGSIGTVISISSKRKDVRVDFGNYKRIYNEGGYLKSGDIWSRDCIVHLTPKLEKYLAEKETISKCVMKFDEMNSKLTFEQAEKILEILGVVE